MATTTVSNYTSNAPVTGTGAISSAAPATMGQTLANAADTTLGTAGGGGPVAVANPPSQHGTPANVDYSKNGAADFVAQRPTSGQAAEDLRLAENTKININDGTDAEKLRARQDLVKSTTQINDTSVREGNSGDICGAAAQTNALILTEKDGKNAAALEKLVQKDGITMSDDEKTALADFKSGNLSPKDVEHLQQVVFRTGVKEDTGQEPKGVNVTAEGLELAAKESWYKATPQEQAALNKYKSHPDQLKPGDINTLKQMAVNSGLVQDQSEIADGSQTQLITHHLVDSGVAGMTGALRGQGAYADGPNVTFNLSTLRDPQGHTANHWTTEVNGITYNSVPKQAGGPTQISDTPPPEVATSPSSPNFVGLVSLQGRGDGQTMNLDLYSNHPGVYDRVTFKPSPNGGDAAWQRAEGDFQQIERNRNPNDPNITITQGRPFGT